MPNLRNEERAHELVDTAKAFKLRGMRTTAGVILRGARKIDANYAKIAWRFGKPTRKAGK